MICKNCGNVMRLDDVDNSYFWDITYYFICPVCNLNCAVNKSLDIENNCQIISFVYDEKGLIL